jgi:MSHA biogenesis protein MshI
VLSWVKKAKTNSWRVGVMPAERETALAIVQRVKAGPPLLRHCAVHSVAEILPEQVFVPLNHDRELTHAPVSAVISPNDYQLVQVPSPDVPATEMRSAVRWALRDIINYPVSEAVVDVFGIPEQARQVEKRMVFAVAAREAAVNRLIDLVKPRVRGFKAIDIPELCLRNLTGLLPQDEEGVALLALGSDFAQLVLTCQRTLYLTRRIDLRSSSDILSLDEGAELSSQGLAIELQRSLNYYESHYDRAPMTHVFVVSGDGRAERMLEPLRDQTGLECHLFDVHDHFDVEGSLEPNMQFPGLCALGAALRTDWTGA